jgi:hypothetical protein
MQERDGHTLSEGRVQEAPRGRECCPLLADRRPLFPPALAPGARVVIITRLSMLSRGFSSAVVFVCLGVVLSSQGCGSDDGAQEWWNGAGSGGKSSAPVTSTPCTSDKTCTPNEQLCDDARSICVDCMSDSDCGDSARCVEGFCETFASCTNSRDCAANQVCELNDGRCVECLGDEDCPKGSVCGEQSCRATCVSDKDCTESGLLCDRGRGYCVTCIADVDCGGGGHCEAGSCLPNVCKPESSICFEDRVLTCDARGFGYTSEACSGTCDDRGGAHCVTDESGGAGGANATGGRGTGGSQNTGGTAIKGGTDSGGQSTGGAGGVGETGGSGGAESTGGSGGVCGDGPDSLEAPSCGTTPGTTTKAFSGIVNATIRGVLIDSVSSHVDAFYNVDPANNARSLSACVDCIRFNRESEGACVCRDGCQPGVTHMVTDALVGEYPEFQPNHVYRVQLDLGPGAERLNFGMSDCGCADNAGSLTIELEPAEPVACP